MEKLKFKTTIKCTGCIEKVSPYLDAAVGTENWKVDITNPDKVLTISNESIDADTVIKAVRDAGYKAEHAG
jgi:copper chaperone CopZ